MTEVPISRGTASEMTQHVIGADVLSMRIHTSLMRKRRRGVLRLRVRLVWIEFLQDRSLCRCRTHHDSAAAGEIVHCRKAIAAAHGGEEQAQHDVIPEACERHPLNA